VPYSLFTADEIRIPDIAYIL